MHEVNGKEKREADNTHREKIKSTAKITHHCLDGAKKLGTIIAIKKANYWNIKRRIEII
jgi:hypothetical protein